VWNYQYGFNSGDSETIYPFWWSFRNTKTAKMERRLKFEWHFLNYVHRVEFDPIPAYTENPGEIYRGIYSLVKEPFDLANTQLLIHRYQDDAKRDDAWLYLGFSAGCAAARPGGRCFWLRSDDRGFEGNGAPDYTWEYAGTRNLIAVLQSQ
jgi:hypothetical protein